MKRNNKTRQICLSRLATDNTGTAVARSAYCCKQRPRKLRKPLPQVASPYQASQPARPVPVIIIIIIIIQDF